jgi:hypothetical protein
VRGHAGPDLARRVRAGSGGGISKLLKRVQRSRSRMSTRGWRPTSRGAAVSDALLDPVARGRAVDRLDPAALQAGNDLFQALPPPVRIEQGRGLGENPVVFG